MSFFGGGRRNDGYDDSERITESYTTTDYDRGYGGGPRRDDERVSETTTTYYDNNNNLPPPPQCPYPWRPQWEQRDGRYIFVNEQTGERRWDFPRGGGGGYEETTTTTTDYYDGSRGGPRYGGGDERVYQQTDVVQEDRGAGRSGGGGHGLMYGALGAAAGLAGGAFLMHEGEKVEDRFEDDKYRVEDDVENFPEDAAQWTGRKVGEVEDIPQDIDQGFDRFGNRIEQGFDDVVDAPEEAADWAGRKVGDVERFDDNVDDAYDEGKFEGRNDGW